MSAIDIDRLSTWLAENVDGFAGPLPLMKFDGGQSNPTYLLKFAN
jgi:aminoglycoside phosphotransferase (APT) family kinase protein